MAMNKKEAAEMERLLTRAEMATALGWPQFPKPVPKERPKEYSVVDDGWVPNSHNQTVEHVWRRGDCHYTNPELRNGYRNGGPAYATEREAWQAMLHELAEEYAETLAEVRAKAFREGW